MHLIRQHHILFALLRWAMVVIFVFGQTPLAGAGTCLLASFSSEHDAQLQNVAGRVTIILHHRRTACHRHTPLTKALLIFANSTDNGQQDHVMEISSAAHCYPQSGKSISDLKCDVLLPVALLPENSGFLHWSSLPGNSTAARPPPEGDVDAASGTLRCLRTIVMLV
jgi:hypothetical protein